MMSLMMSATAMLITAWKVDVSVHYTALPKDLQNTEFRGWMQSSGQLSNINTILKLRLSKVTHQNVIRYWNHLMCAVREYALSAVASSHLAAASRHPPTFFPNYVPDASKLLDICFLLPDAQRWLNMAFSESKGRRCAPSCSLSAI